MTKNPPNRFMLDSVTAQERHARAAFAPERAAHSARHAGVHRPEPRDWLGRDDYTCPQLLPTNNRPGAFDNLAHPSLIGTHRVMPRQFEAHRHVINPALLPKE